MKNNLVILILFLIPILVTAQETLTLEECYELAHKNYPLAKQSALIGQKSVLEIESANKAKLPKVDLNAQATYQSEVIGLPIAIPRMEPLNKDQYRATLDINQNIYNGGTIDANARLKQVQSKTQQQQVEVNLYQLKSRINQYYFSILLLQEKRDLLLSKSELLSAKIKEVKIGVKYGAILPASELILEAEMLKITQQLTEIKFEKKTMFENLSQLTSTQIDTETKLVVPESSATTSENKRPELTFFDLQSDQLDMSKELVSKSQLPKLNAFGQVGYGNPGLNMLDNSFQPFYIVGLKANWNILDWGKTRKDLSALEISKEMILSEKESFMLNNAMELNQVKNDSDKIQELLLSDQKIIETREKIVQSANAQMKNGVITTSEYLTEVTNLFEAKNTLKLHEVQLSLSKSNYKIISGN